jgi:hypothetical protein
MRRGAARPRRSDQAAAGETLSRAGRRPHRRACMGCRAPQAPSTRTRLGVAACGRSAWWPRRSGCRPRLRHPVHVLGRCPVSGVRCPVRATSVHGCLSTGPLSSVRCGRLSVQVSAVRRPVSASGVCALPRALCPAEVRSWSAAWAGSRMAGMAGVGVVACPVHGQFVGCPGRNLAVEAGVGRAGSAEGSAWTWPSSWEVFGLWRGRARGQPGLAGWGAGIARWWRAGVRSEVATTLRGRRVRPRAESPGRCEPAGLDCDVRVRPWCGRSMQ